MKTLVLFLVFGVIAVSCTYLPDVQIQSNKDVVGKQKNLLRLLNNVYMQNTNRDQLEIGNNFLLEKFVDKFTNPKAVNDFYACMKRGLLPKYDIFSINNDKQRQEAVALFHLFYHAKDYDTFYKSACWARNYVNEGVFIYALTVAVRQRQDCRGLYIPPPYEIYPFYFVNSDVIEKATRVKTQEKIINKNLAHYHGVEMNGDTIIIKAFYSGRDLYINDEQRLNYFTEDVGLNTYYYNFHTKYPFWIGGEQHGLKDYRGEKYYYFMQQLLARYYMERLSNGLGEIPKFMLHKPIKTGMISGLQHINGRSIPSRPNYYDLVTESNIMRLQIVDDGLRRIRDAVVKGYTTTVDGAIVSLKKPEDINILGNIIQGNLDSPNTRLYKPIGPLIKSLLGNTNMPFYNSKIVPSVLQQYQTALRDPMFYQIYAKLIRNALKFKNMLEPYTVNDLFYNGVEIQNIKVDNLVTYYDLYDWDMTNSLYMNPTEREQGKQTLKILARQYRLNHKPFDLHIDVKSDKATDVVIRTFLGPKYDSMKRLITLNENRYNFFEMDRYVYNLRQGVNNIVRSSQDFMVSTQDCVMTTQVLNKVEQVSTVDQSLQDVLNCQGYPDRLLLPRGKKGGMPFQFYVIITPIRSLDTLNINNKSDKTSVNMQTLLQKHNYGYAQGYPFDRKIDETQFMGPNMRFLDVLVYHIGGKYQDLVNRDMTTVQSIVGLDKYSHNFYGQSIQGQVQGQLGGLDVSNIQDVQGQTNYGVQGQNFYGGQDQSLYGPYDQNIQGQYGQNLYSGKTLLNKQTDTKY